MNQTFDFNAGGFQIRDSNLWFKTGHRGRKRRALKRLESIDLARRVYHIDILLRDTQNFQANA